MMIHYRLELLTVSIFVILALSASPINAGSVTKKTRAENETYSPTKKTTKKKSQQVVTPVKKPKSAPADLKIMSIQINPETPTFTSAPVYISTTVQNVGGSKSPKKSSLMMSIFSVNSKNSKNVIPGTALTAIYPSYSMNIPELLPGKKVVKMKKIPSGFPSSDWHWLRAQINTEGFSLDEEKFQNNEKDKWFFVRKLRPDLVICFKKINRSKILTKSSYPVKIKNIGEGSSPSTCKLYFQIDGKGTKQWTLPAINPGEVFGGKQRTIYWHLKNNGIHSFQIRIACPGNAQEKVGNNIFEGQIAVPLLQHAKNYTQSGWVNSKTVCSDTFQ